MSLARLVDNVTSSNLEFLANTSELRTQWFLPQQAKRSIFNFLRIPMQETGLVPSDDHRIGDEENKSKDSGPALLTGLRWYFGGWALAISPAGERGYLAGRSERPSSRRPRNLMEFWSVSDDGSAR